MRPDHGSARRRRHRRRKRPGPASSGRLLPTLIPEMSLPLQGDVLTNLTIDEVTGILGGREGLAMGLVTSVKVGG